VESGDGFLNILRRGRFEGLAELTNIPTAGYPGLFGARLKYSSIATIHPAPKFSGRRAGIGVRGGTLVCWDDIVLDIGDEKKKVALKTGSNGVLSVSA